MSVVETQRLRGRMQFMDGQMLADLEDWVCEKSRTMHSHQKTDACLKRTVGALRRFVIFLEHAEPSTDACFWANTGELEVWAGRSFGGFWWKQGLIFLS